MIAPRVRSPTRPSLSRNLPGRLDGRAQAPSRNKNRMTRRVSGGRRPWPAILRSRYGASRRSNRPAAARRPAEQNRTWRRESWRRARAIPDSWRLRSPSMIAKTGSRGCALFAGKSATFVAFGRDTREGVPSESVKSNPAPGLTVASAHPLPPCRCPIFCTAARPMPVPAKASRACSRANTPKSLFESFISKPTPFLVRLRDRDRPADDRVEVGRLALGLAARHVEEPEKNRPMAVTCGRSRDAGFTVDTDLTRHARHLGCEQRERWLRGVGDFPDA